MLLYPILCVVLPRIVSALVGTNPDLVRMSSFPMGSAEVTIARARSTVSLQRPHHKREVDPQSQRPHTQGLKGPTGQQSMNTLDLTPASYNTTCYPGSFQPPSPEDCLTVIQAQLYNSTGSLEASPGDYVFVSYGTCATVFQNPMDSVTILQYNWAELGSVASKLFSKCLLHSTDFMGGAALINPYLGRTWENVIIDLQRFDDREIFIRD